MTIRNHQCHSDLLFCLWHLAGQTDCLQKGLFSFFERSCAACLQLSSLARNRHGVEVCFKHQRPKLLFCYPKIVISHRTMILKPSSYTLSFVCGIGGTKLSQLYTVLVFPFVQLLIILQCASSMKDRAKLFFSYIFSGVSVANGKKMLISKMIGLSCWQWVLDCEQKISLHCHYFL